MNTKEAYQIVYKELIKNGLFSGCYDAKHGSMTYMYGIEAVMGEIAFEAGEFETFSKCFSQNLENSAS